MVKVWTCKIVLPNDASLSDGADFPPRRAAMEAVTGITDRPIVGCFSGWGGTLTESEAAYLRIEESDHDLDSM
jgi:hypothetical protein